MFAGAVALLGAYELSDENIYFMQTNRQSTGFDIMSVKQNSQNKKGIQAELAQLEITEFGVYSKTDSIIEFLKETKFSKKKSYGDNTLIICLVNKPIPLVPQKLIEEARDFTSPVYVIGRIAGTSLGDFTIQAINKTPTKVIDFNVYKTASKYSIPPRVDFEFKIEEKIKFYPKTVKGMTTYEILGLNREKIYNIFKIEKQQFNKLSI